MFRIKNIIIAVLFGCASIGRAADVRPVLGNPFGPHGVGLKVVQQFDRTRSFLGPRDLTGQPVRGERSRPIQTWIWYPADIGQESMTYVDYRRLALAQFQMELSPDELAEAAQQLDDPPIRPDLGRGATMRENRRAMRAGLEAKQAAGRFPVVVYAPSLSAAAMENADLCEYLASWGYLVLASPSLGSRAQRMTLDPEGVESQVADLAFLSGFARSLPNAAPDQLAVLGFSWGALANVLAAAKDSRISALICLDGAVPTYPRFLEEAKYATPDRIRIPILFFAGRSDSGGDPAMGKADLIETFLDGLKFSDSTLVNMHGMQHWHFSSYYLRFMPDSEFRDRPCAEVSRSYDWMARYSLEFLNANLKGDARAGTFMKNAPGTNGVPDHLLTVRPKRAHGFDLQALADETGRRGFQHLAEAYRDGRAGDAGCELGESQLGEWGSGLLNLGRTDEAIAIFGFLVQLDPSSAHAHSQLGQAFHRKGDTGSARASYARALELDPLDRIALGGLEQIDGPSGSPRGAAFIP